MEKSKQYHRVKFSARLVRAAVEACRTRVAKDVWLQSFSTTVGDEEWTFNNIEEFFAEYARSEVDSAYIMVSWQDAAIEQFTMHKHPSSTRLTVKGRERNDIEAIFALFEEAQPSDKITVADTSVEIDRPTIFIGHGRRREWEKLKSHLQDKHDLNVIAYETGARAGHSIRDILTDLSEQSSFALLVLTGEDKTAEGLRARQNVIHECGLFQGRLGFERAIMLVEKGIELASNFDGIQQLRFRKGGISEVFGDVLATLRREFGPL